MMTQGEPGDAPRSAQHPVRPVSCSAPL